MITSRTPCSCSSPESGDGAESNASREVAAVFKAMGHPTRLTLIDALRDGERCVCDLAALVPGELSTVSRHLMSLKHAGIIDDRRDGKRIYYRLKLDCVAGFVGCVAARLTGEE